MFREFTDEGELRELIKKETAVLVLFSSRNCQVCHALKPRLREMIAQSFPLITMVPVETEQIPVLAAENRVFTVPVVLVFFGGREFIRKTGSFSLAELHSEIDRLYQLMLS
ncbi:MAG: thioredoxin family protein [Mangrovibacterium sp.]